MLSLILGCALAGAGLANFHSYLQRTPGSTAMGANDSVGLATLRNIYRVSGWRVIAKTYGLVFLGVCIAFVPKVYFIVTH